MATKKCPDCPTTTDQRPGAVARRIEGDVYPWTRYVTGGCFITAYAGIAGTNGRGGKLIVACEHRHRKGSAAKACARRLVAELRKARRNGQ